MGIQTAGCALLTYMTSDSFTRVLSMSSSRNAFACSSTLLSNLLLVIVIVSIKIVIALYYRAKVGRGLIRGILTLPHDDHYRPLNATWTRDLYFLGLFDGKTQEKRQSKA